MTLSLAEWLELEQILSSSRKARRMFRQRARRRWLRWRISRIKPGSGFFTGAHTWMTAARLQ